MKKIILIALLAITVCLGKSNKTNEDELVKVEFKGSSDLTKEGKNYLIFKFAIEEEWHIYWKNPGDSGIPTEIKLQTPQGMRTGKILWPAPKKFPFDDLANYGYSNEVELIVPLYVNEKVENGNYEIKAFINWLVCKEKCLGQDTSFTIKVNVADKKDENEIDLSDYYHKMIQTKARGNKHEEVVRLILPDNIGENYQFFPFEGGIFVHGEDQKFIKNNIENSLLIRLDQYRISQPKSIQGLLIDTKSGGEVYQVNARIIYNDINTEED